MGDAKWTFSAFAASKALAFLTTAILARVLSATDFGLIAFVLALTGIMLVIADLGVGNTLMTRENLSEADEGAIFAVYVLMGPVVGVATGVVAVVTSLVGAGRLGGLFAGAAVMFSLSGPAWFYIVYSRRLLRFRLYCIAQIAQAATAFSVALALGFSGAGVWALLLGQAAGTLALTLVYLGLLRKHVRPNFDVVAMRSAISHGRGFLAQSALGYVSQNVDNLTVGLIRGSTSLGYYSMAYRLAETPYQAIGNPIYQVTFPKFALLKRNGGNPYPEFLRSVTLLSMVTAPIGATMVFASTDIVRIVYGEGWSDVAPVLAVLGVWAVLRPIQAAVGWLLNSLNFPNQMARVAAWMLALLVPSLSLAAWLGGPVAVAYGMLVSLCLNFSALLVLVRRLTPYAAHEVLSAMARPTALALGVVYMTTVLMHATASAVGAGIAALTGGVVYLLALSVLDSPSRQMLGSGWAWARQRRGAAT